MCAPSQNRRIHRDKRRRNATRPLREIAPSLQLLKKYHLEVLEVFLTAHFFHGGGVKADNAAADKGAGPGAGRRHPEGVQRGWGFPSRALKGRRREREAITPLQGLRPEKEYSRTSSTQAWALLGRSSGAVDCKLRPVSTLRHRANTQLG